MFLSREVRFVMYSLDFDVKRTQRMISFFRHFSIVNIYVRDSGFGIRNSGFGIRDPNSDNYNRRGPVWLQSQSALKVCE